MEDTTNAETTAQTNSQPNADATAQTSPLDAKLAALEKTVNSLAAALRRQNEPTTKPTKSAAQDAELAERLKALEERQNAVNRNATRQYARAAFLDAGVIPDALDDAVELFLVRHGEKISYDDISNLAMVKTSEIDPPKTVQDFIAEQAKAGRYDRYRAAKAAPTKGFSTQSAGVGSDGKIHFATTRDFAAASARGGLDFSKVVIDS